MLGDRRCMPCPLSNMFAFHPAGSQTIRRGSRVVGGTRLDPLRWVGTSAGPKIATSTASHEAAVASPHPPPSPVPRNGARSFMIAMSLRSLPRASIGPRSHIGATAWSLCRAQGVGRIAQRRWASNDMKNSDEKPFYHQLQESIYERVQKEKAEQILIQSLKQRTARGEFFATVAGTTVCRTRKTHAKASQHV
jgi:hypothetical protein